MSTGTTKNGSFRKWLSWIFCRDGQHRALGMIPPPSQQSPKIPSKDLNYIFRFFSSYGFTMKALAILDFNFPLHGLCYSMFTSGFTILIFNMHIQQFCIFSLCFLNLTSSQWRFNNKYVFLYAFAYFPLFFSEP